MKRPALTRVVLACGVSRGWLRRSRAGSGPRRVFFAPSGLEPAAWPDQTTQQGPHMQGLGRFGRAFCLHWHKLGCKIITSEVNVWQKYE